MVVPKRYLAQVGEDGFKKHPIGLGPYKFASHTPGVELGLEAYEGYWRKVPHVKRLIIKGIPEATTRLAMLKKGEADFASALQGAVARARLRMGAIPISMSCSCSRPGNETRLTGKLCCIAFSSSRWSA
jgi:ABC-type transport system substrate-binding protein